MGVTIIECFKSKEEAEQYIENQEEKDIADRMVVYYEPEFCKELPWTVNID